jgi:DNA-binding NarL/FixJ family response regulator
VILSPGSSQRKRAATAAALTDLSLQRGSGFGCAHTLSTHGPHQRVYILANNTGLDIRKRTLALAVDAVCDKSTESGSL